MDVDGEAKTTRVLYKAIADFSDLTRKAAEARKEIADLQAAEAKVNSDSAKGSAATEAATKKVTAANKDRADSVKKVAEETKSATKAVDDHAASTDKSAASTKKAAAEAENHAKQLSVTERMAASLTRSLQSLMTSTDRSTASHARHRSAIRASGDEANRTSTLMDKLRSSIEKSAKEGANFKGLGILSLIPALGGLLGMINPLVSGLGAVGAGAVGLASNIGSLAGAALGAVPALASLLSVFAAFKIGFGGISNVFKAFSASQKATGRGGGGTPQKAQLSQMEELQRAQDKYARSIEDVKFAEEDLDAARKAAIKRLDDLTKAVDRAAMSEARANANAQLARENYANVLADPGSTKGQKMDAAVSLDEAKANVVDVQQQNRQNAADLAKMQQDGIEGDRQVIMAKRALVDAINAERDAQLNLINTQNGSNRAASAGAAASNAFKAALDKLSPSARAVVLTIIGMQGAWRDLQKTVQEQFFSRIVGDVKNLNLLFPALKALLGDTAGALGDVASKFLKMVESAQWLADFRKLGQQNVPIIKNLGDGLLSVLNILRDLTFAAGPFTIKVTESLKGAAANLESFVSTARSSGKLADWLSVVSDRLSQWWRIIKNIGETIFNFGKASQDLGQWIVDGFEKITQGWVDSSKKAVEVGSPFRKYLEDIKPLLSEVAGLFGDFFRWFTRQSGDSQNQKFFQDLIKSIRDDLGPAIARVLDALTKSGSQKSLVDALVSILDAVSTFLKNGGAESMGTFMKTLAGIADAIKKIIDVLPAPVVTALATGLATIAALKFVGLTSLLNLMLKVMAGNKFGSLLDSILGTKAGGGAHAAESSGVLGKIASKIGIGGAAKVATSTVAEGEAGAVGGGLLSRLGGSSLAGAVGKAGLGRLAGGLGVGLIGSAADYIGQNIVNDHQGGSRTVGGSALSGAGKGAAAGALVGSVVPVLGTAVGAGIGAGVGAIGGLASGISHVQDPNERKARIGGSISGFLMGGVGGAVLGGVLDPKQVDGFITGAEKRLQGFFSGLGKKVSDWVGSLWDNIQDLPSWLADRAKDFEDWLATLPERVAYNLGELWGNIQNLGDWLSARGDDFVAWLGTVPEMVIQNLGTLWDNIQSLPGWLAARGQEFWNWLTGLPAMVGQGAAALWNALPSILGYLGTQLGNFWNWVTSLPGQIGKWAQGLWNGLPSIGQWFTDRTNELINWVKSIPGTLAATAASIGGGVWDWITSKAASVKDAFTAGAASTRKNAGGLIYREEGGSVPGEGDGDTVPAMLTPGEFVVRKGIVNKVGAANLAMLNAGALSFTGMLQNASKSSASPSFFNQGGFVPDTLRLNGGGMVPTTEITTGSSNTDIKIYNPVAETSSESIPSALRKAAYLGGRPR